MARVTGSHPDTPFSPDIDVPRLLPPIESVSECFIQAIHGMRMSRPYIGT